MTTRTKPVRAWDPFQRAADWAKANTANTAAAAADRLRRVAEAYWAKHPDAAKAAPKPTAFKPEVGPQTQEAMLLSEALRKAQRSEIAEAMAPNGNHKLERFVHAGSYGSGE